MLLLLYSHNIIIAFSCLPFVDFGFHHQKMPHGFSLSVSLAKAAGYELHSDRAALAGFPPTARPRTTKWTYSSFYLGLFGCLFSYAVGVKKIATQNLCYKKKAGKKKCVVFRTTNYPEPKQVDVISLCA